MDHWPKDVGICAIHFVVPSLFVDQADLERYDKVAKGKYTIGLGQKQMGFCTDLEDINSLCLTAVTQLVENNNINYLDIGRLEVGTETIIDKSKSVKTVLMKLFEPSGNFEVEGIDTTNACYGGTAALFNALSWIESSAWDGRLAIVVAADIAIYAKGNARPTGGAGAVAMLIGPNASLVIERGLRGTYMSHAYDFFKPDLTSEYPVVDGKLSIQCYLNALDQCYKLYLNKCKDNVNLHTFDSFVFHTPYCKLVQKSLARLYLNDFMNSDKKEEEFPGLEIYKDIKLADTYFDRDIEKIFMERSKNSFEKMTKPSLLLASRVGNMYTPSVYGGLASYLISLPPEELPGKKIGLFSYGSGFASSMFSIKIVDNKLPIMIRNLQKCFHNLNRRICVTPEKFTEILEIRQKSIHRAPYVPVCCKSELFLGTWYLSNVDELYRRYYKQIEEKDIFDFTDRGVFI